MFRIPAPTLVQSIRARVATQPQAVTPWALHAADSVVPPPVRTGSNASEEQVNAPAKSPRQRTRAQVKPTPLRVALKDKRAAQLVPGRGAAKWVAPAAAARASSLALTYAEPAAV
jgi:hypothetical protein